MSRARYNVFGVSILATTFACGSSDDSTFKPGGGGPGNHVDSGSGTDDGGGITIHGADGGISGGDSGAQSGSLMLTIRDFKFYDANDSMTNPDFENEIADDRDIVTDTLGADSKPVYKGPAPTSTTHSEAGFNQWYNDTPGVNINVQYPISLTQDGSVFEFDSEKTGVPLSSADMTKYFFPIDDGTPYATAFGNQGASHNYSFTVELHTKFTYTGGEYFNFRGDDDVFVYINNKLAINLGGVHGAEPASVMLDTLGLTKGQMYPLDFFSAERHTSQSNVLFSTTLNLQPAVPN